LSDRGPVAELYEDRLDWLTRNPLVINAARIAHTFGMDPVAVLRDEGDPLIMLVRTAAAHIIADDEERQARAAR
jgi:hypothetical protein